MTADDVTQVCASFSVEEKKAFYKKCIDKETTMNAVVRELVNGWVAG
jgi:hypothetical protein